MEEKVIQINVEITINVHVSLKNVIYVKKSYVWNPAPCSYENGKYLASIMDDSVIVCDYGSYDEDAAAKSYDKTKTVPTNLNEKKQLVKHKISIFYLHFY